MESLLVEIRHPEFIVFEQGDDEYSPLAVAKRVADVDYIVPVNGRGEPIRADEDRTNKEMFAATCCKASRYVRLTRAELVEFMRAADWWEL